MTSTTRTTGLVVHVDVVVVVAAATQRTVRKIWADYKMNEGGKEKLFSTCVILMASVEVVVFLFGISKRPRLACTEYHKAHWGTQSISHIKCKLNCD